MSQNNVFSLELAKQLYDSAERFPIDFDDAWVWLEFSSKGNAKRSFENAGFVDGIDFEVFIIPNKNPSGGRPAEQIRLACDCFKHWGMMAGTEKGKQIRLYFIECERIAKSKDLLRNLPLTQETIKEIKKLIVELASRGEIRSTEDGYYSVLDVIRKAGDKKAPSSSWSQLKHRNDNGYKIVDFYCYHIFPGRGNCPTPVTSLDGCVYIINLLPGEMRQKMRCLSVKVKSQETPQVSKEEFSVNPTTDASMPQMFALMQAQNQQVMAAMMQMQQENNRQIQSVLNVLTQVVVTRRDA
jgi:phage anti-repressor protein